MSVYDYSATTINGEEKNLSDYEGKVLLVVNTATGCGLAPQLEGLQALYDKYNSKDFEILGFPSNQFANQEKGSDEEINQVCKRNYGVTFPMFSKINVNGSEAHPLFKHLTTETKGILGGSIKWNFTKFLIDRNGNIIERFSPKKKPEAFEEDIKKLVEAE